MAFDLCVHGFGSWRDRALMLQDLRGRMPEGFSIYLSESAVLAMILSSRTAIFKSVVITVICMAIICFFFIPSFRAMTAAIISVVSITVGRSLNIYNILYLFFHEFGAILCTVAMIDWKRMEKTESNQDCLLIFDILQTFETVWHVLSFQVS